MIPESSAPAITSPAGTVTRAGLRRQIAGIARRSRALRGLRLPVVET
ncbi:MAG: hypothetical protein HKP61_15365, partial [Dactylosporangium sp.]|nr:hypothetical protein [Dactylosporangium sp.]